MVGYTYDEFGDAELTMASSFKNDVIFTGAVADSTGLYYMNARFYNPNTQVAWGAINSEEFMTSRKVPDAG